MDPYSTDVEPLGTGFDRRNELAGTGGIGQYTAMEIDNNELWIHNKYENVD